MEKYNLEQTGQEVQNILNEATPQSELTAETERAQLAEQQLQNDIDAIEEKIPSGASSSNKLATEEYVDDSVSTATATFRGTFNLVSDLGLTVDATEQQIAAALASEISTADNNDYCFVQIPTSAETPTEIEEIDRYKFNGAAWSFEYELNNSGFTADQWNAINSHITSGDVTKLLALPTNAELNILLNGKQDVLTFDNVPTENSNNPVKSGGVKSAIDDEKGARINSDTALQQAIDGINGKIPSDASSENKLATASDVDDEATARSNADQSLQDAIEAILLLIPTAASSLNQLADKAFVNSSIATNTATFRGTFNLVNDLHLTLAATHAQVGNALALAIQESDNNDYAFVQIPTVETAPNEIAQTDRYKFNGSTWEYEYTLNNSGFTSAQWIAINSGITEALVTKLSALPTNADLTTALGVLTSSITTINQKIPSAASQDNQLVDIAAMESYIVQVLDVLTASFNVTSSDGHVTVQISQVDGKITSVALTTLDIASAASLSLVEGRVTTAEGNISTNSADIAILQDAYAALTQSALVIVKPTDTWPVANPATSTIYRVVDRTNTPPQNYSDYMWNGTTMVMMAQYDNAIDDTPILGSNNLVKSGGVVTAINQNPKIGYYTCISGAYTQEKTITVSNYILSNGGAFKIKFINSHENTSLVTLNINGTGAKPLYYQGRRATFGNVWYANEIVEVYYDGSAEDGTGAYFCYPMPLTLTTKAIGICSDPKVNGIIRGIYVKNADPVVGTEHQFLLRVGYLIGGLYYNYLHIRTLGGSYLVYYQKSFNTLAEALNDFTGISLYNDVYILADNVEQISVGGNFMLYSNLKSEIIQNYIRCLDNMSYIDETENKIEDLKDSLNIINSINIFNPDDCLEGYWVYGELRTLEGYYVSGKMPVENGKTYKYKPDGNLGGNRASVTLFDENMTQIGNDLSLPDSQDNSFYLYTVSNSNVKYVSVNVGRQTVVDVFMFCLESQYPDIYVQYYNNFPTLNNPLAGNLIVFDGDSIMASDGIDYGWSKMLAEKNKMAWKSIAVGGGTITDNFYQIMCWKNGNNTLYTHYMFFVYAYPNTSFIDGEKSVITDHTLSYSDDNAFTGTITVGGVVYNFSEAGSVKRHTICTGLDYYENEVINPDYIVFDGGCNDALPLPSEFFGSSDIDDYSGNYNRNTFCGALDYLFYKAATVFKDSKFGFIITPKMMVGASGIKDYSVPADNIRVYYEKVMEICKKWGVPYINLWDECRLNPSILAQYNPSLTPQQNAEAGNFYLDGQHPTPRGYEVTLSIIESWLKGI